MGLSGESCSSHYIKEGGYVTAVGLFRGGTWAELNASRCVKRERVRRKRPVAYVYAHMKEMKGGRRGGGGTGSLRRVQSNAEPEARKARCSLGQPRYPNSTREAFSQSGFKTNCHSPAPEHIILFNRMTDRGYVHGPLCKIGNCLMGFIVAGVTKRCLHICEKRTACACSNAAN